MNKKIFFISIQLVYIIINMLIPSKIITILSMFNYIIFIGYNYKKNFIETIVSFLLVFLSFIQIIGCFVIEYNFIYLFELKKYSFFKGSLPELIFIYMILFQSLFYFLKRENLKKKILNNTIKKLKLSQVYVSFIIIFTYNFYFLQKTMRTPYYKLNLDRFNYNIIVFNKIEFFLFKLIFIIPIVLMYIYIRTKLMNKIIVIINFMLIMLILFLSGNKFGEYINIIYYAFLIFLPKIIRHIKKLKKFLNKIALLFLLIIIITYNHKKMYSSDYNVYKFYNYTLQRLAQQGQLWWGTYDKKYEGTIEEFILEFKSNKSEYLYNKDMKEQSGIWKIMLMNAPKEVVEKKFESNSRYTASTKASLNYYFGILGNIIFGVISARMYSLLFSFFYVNCNSLFLIILKYLLYIKLYGRLTTVVFMSDFWAIFDIRTLILVILAIIFYIFNKNK